METTGHNIQQSLCREFLEDRDSAFFPSPLTQALPGAVRDVFLRVGSSPNIPHAVFGPHRAWGEGREVVEPSLRLSSASLISKIAHPNAV